MNVPGLPPDWNWKVFPLAMLILPVLLKFMVVPPDVICRLAFRFIAPLFVWVVELLEIVKS